MARITAVRGDTLPEAPATPGIIRYMAFQREGRVVVRSRSAPGAISAWHHHGDYEVFGYILSGHERFEFGPLGEDAVTVSQGDFFHIPPLTVHRDVNPSDEELQEAILFFHGNGPIVVNMDGPDRG
jgi:quercetin dioxygenase-like cupin family protein